MINVFGSKVEVVRSEVGETIIEVLDVRDVKNVLRVLKDHSNYCCKVLVDVIGVDMKEEGLVLVYELLSVRYSERVRVKCRLNEDSEVESVVGLFKGSDWLEREVYDMFGVYFRNHGDLRRLLTDYGFKGNPLRKDFNKVYGVRYDEERKMVVAVRKS